MGNLSLLVQVLFFAFSAPTEEKAKISFKQNTIKLGTIYQEERYERVFTFTNTGSAPLILEEVELGCGCTVVKFSKEPIMPGKTGEIKVDYIPKKTTVGFISKSVTVYSNATNSPEHIFLHGNVVKKEKKKRRKK